MTVRATNKRWWIWLPLLGAAAWLAFFGEKTPVPSVVLPPPAKLAAASSDTAVGRPTSSEVQKTAMAASNINASATTRQLSPEQGGKALEMLVPRDQLIVSVKVRPFQARDLFASGGWTPPPAPLQPLPAPVPMAPELPFTFLGKKLEGNAWEVFLARGEQSFVVREGSVLENTYRIDTIRPPSLSLTYLPLGQSQSLLIGDFQ